MGGPVLESLVNVGGGQWGAIIGLHASSRALAKAFSAPKRFAAVVTRRPEDIEPTNEEFLAALILFGPLAYVARWIWRRLRELA